MTKGVSECRDFSADDCEFDFKSRIDTNKVNNEKACQQYCQRYQGTCSYYVFHHKQRMCDVYRSEMDTFAKICNKIIGPVDQPISKCLSTSNSCNVCFIQSLI